MRTAITGQQRDRDHIVGDRTRMGGMAGNAQRSPGQAEDRYDASGTISRKNDAGILQLRIFIRQNLSGDLHHIGAGDVGTWEERVERHAGTRNECSGATSA